MNLTDLQKGYLAGLIDGEGWIGFHKKSGGCSPKIVIAMTSYEALAYVKSIVGVGALHKGLKKYPTDTQQWVYALSANGIRELLPQIAPLLKVKERQAYVVCLFLSYFKPNDRNSMYGLKREVKEMFCRLMHILNSRSNRKRGEFRENLSEATLSQALQEIDGKVQRLQDELTSVKRELVINTLRKRGMLSRSFLLHNHFNRSPLNIKRFEKIMASLKKDGIVKSEDNLYTLCNNSCTSAMGESYEIVRTAGRPVEVKDKELSR